MIIGYSPLDAPSVEEAVEAESEPEAPVEGEGTEGEGTEGETTDSTVEENAE